MKKYIWYFIFSVARRLGSLQGWSGLTGATLSGGFHTICIFTPSASSYHLVFLHHLEQFSRAKFIPSLLHCIVWLMITRKFISNPPFLSLSALAWERWLIINICMISPRKKVWSTWMSRSTFSAPGWCLEGQPQVGTRDREHFLWERPGKVSNWWKY